MAASPLLRLLVVLLHFSSSTQFKIHHQRVPRRTALFAAFSVVSHGSADTGLGYVDDAGAKSYSQVQRAWEKSAEMSEREKFLALRGASKPTDLASESPKSQKRRAMAGCKDSVFQSKAGYKDEASCNARVMSGDVDFMLQIMNSE